MKLYILYRTTDIDYDETAGLVVRAGNEDSARKLAANSATNLNETNWWLDKNQSVIKQILEEGDEEIILVDYRAG